MLPISLSKKDLDYDADAFNFQAIKTSVEENAKRVENYFLNQLRIKSPLLSTKTYSITGSVIVSDSQLKSHTSGFFFKSRRCVKHGNNFHLRGGRYIISSNPTFELRQKLQTFQEDLEDGLKLFEKENSPIFRLAIADYIKNAIITMFNSFLHEEKTGKYKFTNETYQYNRRTFQKYAQHAVDFFLGCLVQDGELINISFDYLRQKKTLFAKIQKHILSEYERGIFSSRHITRPEASHPLVIAAAAHHYVFVTRNNCDVIIGLPAGSTELSLAHCTAQKFWFERDCNVLLLPVSLHSGKLEFDAFEASDNNVHRWTLQHKKAISAKNVVIVDDNSSTGKTIELVASEVIKQSPKSLNFAVAEADIIRSKIDLDNDDRKKIASPLLYKNSVNILPILKHKHTKKDLKEILEKRRILSCTKDRYLNDQKKKHKQIIGQVYLSMIEDPNPEYYSTNKNTISNFRHTFLSNFYETPIIYDNANYTSVEHAYQAMKFKSDIFTNVKQRDLDVINKKLIGRNVIIKLDDLPNLFTNPNLSAGASKIAANQLRILGYVRKDWDYVKAPIMLDLLLQKFSVPDLNIKLIETGDLWLVEGNDWDDTYWGVCNKRGRNVLGRMIMEIRKLELSTIQKLSDKRSLN